MWRQHIVAENQVIVTKINNFMSIAMYLGSAYNLPIPDKSVDLIITHPPFWKTEGSYYGGDTKAQFSKGKNSDRKECWDNLVLATKEMVRVLKDDGSFIINIGQADYPRFNTFEYEHILFCVQELNLILSSEIDWRVTRNIYSFDNLHHEHQIFRQYTKNSQYFRNQFEIGNLNPASWDIPYIEHNPNLLQLGNVGHGFPIELASRMVRCFAKQDAVVCDPFAGTGTVNIAAGLHGKSSIYLDCSSDQYALAKARFNQFKLEVQEK